jgi:4-diphosphocytidyl-2-C-methyl-D-erythritol kinase
MPTLPAYAKVNLVLEVLGDRDDGYRELLSVFQTIDLADTLSLEPDDELTLSCDSPELPREQNSVLQAAELLRREAGYRKGAKISLHKRIPTGGGVGGHSTDAAATLRGLNELWELGLSTETLSQMAARISSDAPFFLHGGTALARGRGDKVTPLPPIPETWLVLLKPKTKLIPGKTAKVCASLSPSSFTSGQLTQRFIQHLSQGLPPHSSPLFNVFEDVAFDFFTQLPWCRSQMLEAGAASVHLTGTGPMLFTIAPDRASAELLYHQLREKGHEIYLAATIEAQPTLNRS